MWMLFAVAVAGDVPSWWWGLGGGAAYLPAPNPGLGIADAAILPLVPEFRASIVGANRRWSVEVAHGGQEGLLTLPTLGYLYAHGRVGVRWHASLAHTLQLTLGGGPEIAAFQEISIFDAGRGGAAAGGWLGVGLDLSGPKQRFRFTAGWRGFAGANLNRDDPALAWSPLALDAAVHVRIGP